MGNKLSLRSRCNICFEIRAKGGQCDSCKMKAASERGMYKEDIEKEKTEEDVEKEETEEDKTSKSFKAPDELQSTIRVLVRGPPGAGATTVCRMLVREFEPLGFNYFAAGDFIRDHIAKRPEFEVAAQSLLDGGEQVPDSLLNGAILDELLKAGSCVVLDGYPRNLSQVKMVEERAPLTLVVKMGIPRKVLIDRLSKQLVHPMSGRAYNLEVNPPKEEGKDDVTGEPLFEMSSDQLEVARRRLEVYDTTEDKVLAYYRKQNKCITVSGESSKVVFESVADIIRRDFNNAIQPSTSKSGL